MVAYNSIITIFIACIIIIKYSILQRMYKMLYIIQANCHAAAVVSIALNYMYAISRSGDIIDL